LCLGLRDASFGLGEAGFCSLPGCLARFVLGFRNQRVLIETFGAGPIEASALDIGFGAVEICFGSVEASVGGDRIGASRLERRLGGGDVGGGLNVLELREQLALLHAITLPHIKVSDFAERVGADVDVGFGLDFAGGADDGGQILALRLASLHDHRVLGRAIAQVGAGDQQHQ